MSLPISSILSVFQPQSDLTILVNLLQSVSQMLNKNIRREKCAWLAFWQGVILLFFGSRGGIKRRCEKNWRIIPIFPVLSIPGVILLFIEIIKNPTCPLSRVLLPFFSLHIQINRVASLLFLGMHQSKDNRGLAMQVKGSDKRRSGCQVKIQYFFFLFKLQLSFENNFLFSIQLEYLILYTAAVKVILPCINLHKLPIKLHSQDQTGFFFVLTAFIFPLLVSHISSKVACRQLRNNILRVFFIRWVFTGENSGGSHFSLQWI